MTRRVIGFFLLLAFSAVSTFAIFAKGQKSELPKRPNDYILNHFMIQYHRLDLRSQGLTEMPNICQDYSGSDLSDIRSIDLGDNKISSVKIDLSCLIQLQDLDLSYNKIESIEKLGNLPNLISLQLQNNQIKKISGLKDFKKLRSLNISFNQIISTDGLQGLSNLQELQLQSNQIWDVSIIKGLKSLEILKLDNNQLIEKDKKEIQNIKGIQDLSI